MKRWVGSILLAWAVAAAGSSWVGAKEPSTFDRMVGHYEEIRQALLHDSIENVAAAAGRIERMVEALVSDPGEGGEELLAVLSELRPAAAEVSKATTIAEARKAFGSLSRSMVRYRQLIGEPAPAVAFCSMAQKVWLQPKGEIGNPYYGQGMARCGEIVSE